MIQKLRPMGAFGMGKLGSMSSLISAIADAITRMEGYFPPGTPGYPNGSLAWQNNNYGNIVFNRNGWNYPGATLGAGGFAKYPDAATGRAALEHQVQVQVDSGQSLTQFFNQYAPSGTVNGAGAPQTSAATQNYINTVSKQLGIAANVPLKSVVDGTYNPPTNPVDTGATVSVANALDPSAGGVDNTDTNVSAAQVDGATTPTSLLDTLQTLDPIVVGVIGVVIAGALWTLYGK